jgi:outer membrane lipase/esterase
MKNQNRLMVVLLLGFSLAIPIFSQAAQAGFKRDFSGLYVFGDSLSDPGNAYAVSGVTVGENYEPIPAAPYDTRRFSNGRTWAEILAGELHTWRGGLPAFRSSFFTNYAFGGARALGGTSPDFGTQVGVFLDSTRGRAPLDALYVVQFGGNDIRAALEAAQTGGNPIDVIVASVGAIVSNINLLRSAGARSFLVANAPNLGRTPAGRAGRCIP